MWLLLCAFALFACSYVYIDVLKYHSDWRIKIKTLIFIDFSVKLIKKIHVTGYKLKTFEPKVILRYN